MTTYYMGVYKNGTDRIWQVSDDIDGLSCELLAEPKVLTIGYATVCHMMAGVKVFAEKADCNQVEVNCSKGKGSYKLIKVNYE